MGWKKAAGYLLVAVLALVLVRVALAVVFDVLSLLWTVLTIVATLLVVGAIAYGGYRLISSVGDDSTGRTTGRVGRQTNREPSGSVGDLQDQYTNGEMTERELEERLETELENSK